MNTGVRFSRMALVPSPVIVAVEDRLAQGLDALESLRAQRVRVAEDAQLLLDDAWTVPQGSRDEPLPGTAIRPRAGRAFVRSR
jgi:hypothetical protein